MGILMEWKVLPQDFFYHFNYICMFLYYLFAIAISSFSFASLTWKPFLSCAAEDKLETVFMDG
jgi:hypothetical protein